MLRFLRAWAWVRWRTRMNAIERGHRADLVQRFTRATEVIGPVMMAVMLVPAALFAAGVGLAAGYGMASGAAWSTPAMHVLRFALAAALLLTIVGPLALPSGHGLASLPRLLLLPVPRRVLFAGEVIGGLAEPWTVMTLLAALMLVGGALAATNVGVAVVGIAAAALLALTFAGLAASFGALLHVLMGNRRRGEWIVVGALTIVSFLGMLPMLLQSADTGSSSVERRTRNRAIEERVAAGIETPASGFLAVVPSELYVASVARAANKVPGTPLWPLAGLALTSAAALGAGWALWQRAIDRVGIASSRGRTRRREARRAPSMRSATAGVAYTFLQHVTRTARGRAIVVPSMLIVMIFAGLVAFRDGIDLGFASVRDGFAFAVFGVAIAFLTPVQLWMNQFAIDKAGLTMLCLQPLSSAAILRGKAMGAAVLIAGLAALPCLIGIALGSGTHPAYWAILAMGAVAGFLFLAPLAALLSIVFPRHVDLTSIGQRSNAHPISSLVGGLLTFAAIAPPAGAAIAGFRLLDSPAAAVGLAAAWLAVAFLLYVLLSRLAVRLFDRRREALVGVANGR